MQTFLIDGLAPDHNATAGQKVTFRVGFDDSSRLGFGDSSPQTGSVKLDHGDGTTADTGPRTFYRPFGTFVAYLIINHVYTKPGTFHASLKGATVENQPCAFSGYFGFGSMSSDGTPQIQVKVVGNPSQSRTKHADAAPELPALTQPKGVVAILPASGLGAKDLGVYEMVGKEKGNSVVAIAPASGQGAKDLGVYEKVGKEKGHLAYALSPGQIGQASVSQSSLGNVLKVEGSGKCGLKVFEELDGKAVEIYDYKGPLPTTIRMVNTLPGMHVAKIEGDKSSEGCGGTASASFPIAQLGRKSRTGAR